MYSLIFVDEGVQGSIQSKLEQLPFDHQGADPSWNFIFRLARVYLAPDLGAGYVVNQQDNVEG